MDIQVNKNTIQPTQSTTTPKVDLKTQSSVVNNAYQKDTVELSSAHKAMINPLSTDKGTAAHTTLYVDNATFQKIATYSTNHPDTKWSEIGVDEDKRWIVINGQRFESPKSEEEKAMAKRSQMTLMDHLQEYYDNKEDVLLKEKVTLDFLDDNKDAQAVGDTKIQNLLQNEEVMDMLKNISKASGGKLSVSF